MSATAASAKKVEAKQSGQRKFDPARLMQVLISPQVSEKSTFVGEKNNQWIFRVLPDATKPEIKAAIELMFKVEVKTVQTMNVRGKQTRRLGRPAGHRRSWKKAFVALKPGHEISLAPGETK